MRGVGCLRFPCTLANLQTILVNDSEETVSAYRRVTGKGSLVHVPKFYASYARVELPNFRDIL